MYANFGKRLVDLALSIFLLLLLLPLLLILTIVVWLSFGRAPFFIQKRPGCDEKLFSIIKFRTMTERCNSSGQLLPDHLRVTPLGKFLRKQSLDELPQLINIVKGEMSFVGPRPLLPDYLPLYNSEQRKRHLVRPGLTGLAQVSGRNRLSWEEKFDLDIQYINTMSLLLDLKVLYRTFLIGTRDCVINNNQVERFTG